MVPEGAGIEKLGTLGASLVKKYYERVELSSVRSNWETYFDGISKDESVNGSDFRRKQSHGRDPIGDVCGYLNNVR